MSNGAWKKKLKKAVKTQNGFKTIMSVLAEEEGKNQALVHALTSIPPASATTSSASASEPKSPGTVRFPATTLKLSSICKKK